ncbi:MAG: hypothetical protein QNL68_17750 [Akkermansiaceae bacterium]|jgi:hypothetical protein
MRKVFLLLSILCGMTFGITLEVCEIHQPLSLHGTDVDTQFQGDQIQAGIFSSPAVLSGAMPESLISAVAAPYRFAPSEHFKIPESNLLVLCGISLTADESEGEIVAVFDLTKLAMPEEVELSVHTVLKLSIEALKKTLRAYQDPENDAVIIRVEIRGTKEGTASLKTLSERFSSKP